MKNNSGFSIVELLIVILIAVILAVISYPTASNIVTSIKANSIEKATKKGFEKYKQDYGNIFSQDKCYDVSFNYLVNNRYMEPIIDTDCKGHIHAVKNGSNYEYEYYLRCSNSKYEIMDNYKEMDETCSIFK